MTPRVMITGAGSGVGQGVAKSLRIGGLPVSIVFADIDSFNPGFYRSDESVIIPKVEEHGALPKIVEIIESRRIDAVLVGSELDLVFFAENREQIEEQTGARIIVSPPAVIEIGLDKWLTVEFLRKAGLPYPRSYVPQGFEDARDTVAGWGYPFVVKGCRGRASRDVRVVRSDEDLVGALSVIKDPILQQMIAEPRTTLHVEYTCSVVKTHDGRVLGPSVARRSLRDGHSWVVEVDEFAALHPLLIAIGKALPIVGAFNIQLMVGPDGPVPFEFNPRFSGSTPIRAHFGFNEPELVLRSYLLGEKPENPVIRQGMAFRYHEEVFVDSITADTLAAPFPRGAINEWF